MDEIRATRAALEATDTRGLQAIHIALRRGVRSAALELVSCGVMPVEPLAGAQPELHAREREADILH